MVGVTRESGIRAKAGGAVGFVEADQGVAGACRVHVKVVPGARQNRVVGLLGDRLKVQVAAPPEDGKANAAVIELLATTLKIDRSRVELLSGASSPRKTFRVGVSKDVAERGLVA